MRSAPKSGLLSGPRSGGAYINRLGPAAAFKKKINGLGGGPPLSGGGPCSGTPPKSTMRSDAILEEAAPLSNDSAPTLPEGDAPTAAEKAAEV